MAGTSTSEASEVADAFFRINEVLGNESGADTDLAQAVETIRRALVAVGHDVLETYDERQARRYQEAFAELHEEFRALKTKGIDTNDKKSLEEAIRIKRLLDVLDNMLTGALRVVALASLPALARESAPALGELQANIRADRDWINEQAFGIKA